MLINHESFKFRLEAEGICSEEKLPSVSSINRIVRSNKRYDHSASSNSSDGSNSNNLSSFGGNANNTLASNSTAAAADALSSSSPMSNLNVAAGLKLNQFNNQLFNLAALASSSANAKNDFSKNLFKMAQTVQRHHLNNRNHDDYLANTTTTSTNTTLDNGEGDEDETVNEFGTDENHLNSHNNTYDDNNECENETSYDDADSKAHCGSSGGFNSFKRKLPKNEQMTRENANSSENDEANNEEFNSSYLDESENDVNSRANMNIMSTAMQNQLKKKLNKSFNSEASNANNGKQLTTKQQQQQQRHKGRFESYSLFPYLCKLRVVTLPTRALKASNRNNNIFLTVSMGL